MTNIIKHDFKAIDTSRNNYSFNLFMCEQFFNLKTRVSDAIILAVLLRVKNIDNNLVQRHNCNISAENSQEIIFSLYFIHIYCSELRHEVNFDVTPHVKLGFSKHLIPWRISRIYMNNYFTNLFTFYFCHQAMYDWQI